MPRLHQMFLACAALLVSAPAQAYVRTVTSTGAPMFWNRTVLSLEVYAGQPPDPLSPNDVIYAAREAAATWSRDRVGCTAVDVRVTSTLEASAPVQLDGINRITFRRDSWCKQPRTADDSCYDPLALAVTSVFARKSDGEIVDADVEINAVVFHWNDLVRMPQVSDNLQDLQNTLTHELGHFLGLDHTCFLPGGRADAHDDQGRPVPSCHDADDTIRATTMFAAVIPGDLDRRTLSDDDIRAVCDLYPPVDLLLETQAPSGCAVAPRRGRISAGPLVLLLGGLLLRGRRRGRPGRDRS
jgi:hypothetical protein